MFPAFSGIQVQGQFRWTAELDPPKVDPKGRGAWTSRVNAKILTTPYDLPDLRGRQEYMEYFED